MNEELNNTTTCPICQPCCPNVKIDKIEEGMTGKEVADLLYNNFDKLNKSKANKCVERKVRHLLKGENKIFNRTAKNKFVQEVFYVWSKKDVNKQLEDFKETTDLLHDHLVDYTNPHQVTKDQVGLGNVDNTSDEDKPISNATQEALNNLTDKVDDVKAEIDDYTVNGYKISNNPVLDGEDIKLDNYSKVTTDTEIQSTDSATVAFGKLEYKLDKEIQDRIEAIDSEENQRKAADEALQNSINIVSTDLAEEIETRVENDNRHQQEIENLQTDLNTEKAVRESEDEVLSDRIYKEVQDRQNAVAAIYDNLEQEAATRLAADEQLQRNIDEEIANRTESDTNIQNNLNTHINDKTNPHEVTKAQVGLGNVTNDAQVKRSEMGAANGVAQLDSSGLVPSSQLPSYVDDVLEYDTLTAFPATGETGKIYVTKDTNLTYRWSGTQYTEISKSLALGETSSTAYAGDKGKANREAIESLPNSIVTKFGLTTRTESDWNILYFQATKTGLNYGAEETDMDKVITIPTADTTYAGLMSPEDKSNLDILVGDGVSEDTPSINDVINNITSIENNIDTIEGNITTIESNIDSIEQNIDTIESNIGTVANLTTEATNLTDAINEHETQINELQQDLTGYLPLTGGTLTGPVEITTGNTIHLGNDNSYLEIDDSEITINNGSSSGTALIRRNKLELYSGGDGDDNARIILQAQDNTSSSILQAEGTPDGQIDYSITIGYNGITLKDKTTNDLLNAAGSTSTLKTINNESLLGDGNIEIVPSYNNATTTEDGLMSAEDKAKLDGIEENANNYTHPDEPGWKHIPAGGTTGQVLVNGGDGVAVWENLNIEDLLSYGVEWDVTVADPALTRIGNPLLHKSLPIQSAYKGCVANGNVINYYLDPNDWSKKADGTASVLDGTDGTVRVHIPKFYGKSGSNGNKRWVRISTTKIDNTWEEIPEMLVDAYRCTVDTTESATPKAVSVVNTTAQFRGGVNRTANDTYLSTDPFRSDLGKPRTGVNRATMRTYAQNAGSQLLSYSYYKWIFYWAWVIEYATFNSQAAYNEELTAEGYHQGGLGAGVTDWQNTATSWSGYNGINPLTPCGYCNEFGNFTGIKDLVIPETVNGSDTIATHTFHVPRWRGFDNPFGDIWTNLDGILIDTPVGVENPVPTAYVVKDSSKFTDNLDTIKSNKDAVFTLCSNEGYIKSWILGETAEMMPETIGGSSTTYMCDYYGVNYDDTPEMLRVGGSAYTGDRAGLCRFDVYYDVSGSYTTVGFRTLTLV